MFKKALLVSTSLVLFLPFSSRADGITTFPDNSSWLIYGVSPDGQTVAGADVSGAVVWNAAGAETTLPGTVSGDYAYAISSNGIIVGQANSNAVFWASSSSSPTIISNNYSSALSISPNGAFIVGLDGSEGFVFGVGSSAETLLSASGDSAQATGVTNNGSVVIGNDTLHIRGYGDTSRPVYWYDAGSGYNEAFLPALSSDFSMANGITPDGSVIVGAIGSVGYPEIAARWAGSPNGGYTLTLIGPNNGDSSTATAVSANGNVVVGWINGSANCAFRWTQTSGMQSVEDWLRSNNVAVNLRSDSTVQASGVSADGNTVVGSLASGDGFIARVSSSSGLITLSDLSASLAGSVPVPSSMTSISDLVLHGSHGHPFLRLVPQGTGTVWMDGDIGAGAAHSHGTYLNLGEFGGGYRVTDAVQLNLSVGQIFAGQKTTDDGNFRQKMTYVLPEAIVHVGNTPIWTTLSFEYANGPLDIRRGYINAGYQDFSVGTPDSSLFNGRVRADWKDAVVWKQATFTPYIDQEHIEASVNSYTETGGGFPVSWDSRHARDDFSRIGLDAVRPLSDTTKIYATLEQSRRWKKYGTGASGTVIGLSTFDLPGQSSDQNSTRVSLGVTQDIGGGQLSLFGNVQTSGDLPRYWLAAGYQYAF